LRAKVGVQTGLSWTDEREKAIEDIKKMNPEDRLSVYSSLIKLNSALFESVRGWDSWLRNPTFMESFSHEELKEIFKEFRDVCVKFLEDDVKWTGKKEKAPPLHKPTRIERMESDRRYV
jgi:hypothetical protein